MQKAVFHDLAWQQEAYLDGGLAALEPFYESGDIDKNTYQGWRQIDDGIRTNNQSEIVAGNTALLYREQKQVLQPYYNELSSLPGGVAMANSMVTNPVPGGAQFAGTDITNFDQRFSWMQWQVVHPFAQTTHAQRNADEADSFTELTTFNHNQPNGKNVP